MRAAVLVLCAAVVVANAQFSTQATFSFRYLPPLPWTAYQAPPGAPTSPPADKVSTQSVRGQSASISDATRRADQDIQSAIIVTLNAYGLFASDFTITSNIQGLGYALINPATAPCATEQNNYYLDANGQLISKCVGTTGTTPPRQLTTADYTAGQIQLRANNGLPQTTQTWQNIANKLWVKLNGNYGVQFDAPFKIS